MAVWYSLWSFGIFFPFWYVWTMKNLATLIHYSGGISYFIIDTAQNWSNREAGTKKLHRDISRIERRPKNLNFYNSFFKMFSSLKRLQ
jgi:hypothetical protein